MSKPSLRSGFATGVCSVMNYKERWVEDLQRAFLKTLNDMIEYNPEQAEEIDIAQLIADVTP